MTNVNNMINYLKARTKDKSNIRYSMYDRYNNPNMDCSSAVYYALIAGGFLPSNAYIGNTETLFNERCLKEINNFNDAQAGDIFILGGQGTSSGSAGHTGVFLDKNTIIHCNYKHNGITINPSSTVLNKRRSRTERYFRPTISKQVQPAKKNDNNKPILIKNEKHTVKVRVNKLHVRDFPSTVRGKIVAFYSYGQSFTYDKVFKCDGYMWLSYIGYSGKRRYVAYRTLNNFNNQYVEF